MSLLAQVAPDATAVTSKADGAYDILLKQGPIGAVCVLLILALVYVFRELTKSKDDRVADAKQLLQDLRGTKDATNDLVMSQSKMMSELSAAVNTSLNQVSSTLRALESEQRDLRMVLDRVKDSQQEVESTVGSLEKQLRK